MHPAIPQLRRMKLRLPFPILVALALCFGFAGCDKQGTKTTAIAPKASTNAAPPPPPTPPTHLPTAQPRLPVMKLQVGNQVVTAELARKPVELATGMMFRKEMREDDGMLFALPFPQQASFYMRNTLVPLTIAYVDPAGRILELHDLNPLDETPVYSRAANIFYVLEMNQGWFARHGVVPGTTIVSEKGRLEQTVKFEPAP